MGFRVAAFAGLAIIWAFTAPAMAAMPDHGSGEAASGGTGTDGMPGNPADAHRTVRIDARDMAFNVKQIQVQAGETIRFVVTNSGKLRHEFVIANHAEQQEHREMMRQMPDMDMANEPNAITIDPGKTKQLIWKFGKDTDVEFACDISGHAEAGMKGVFRVKQ